MTIEGATEGGSGVSSLPSTTGSMRASSSPTSASSPASATLEHPPRSPAAPSEHSSAETESGAQEPARSPEILTNISCANDAELSFLLKLFQISLCKVQTGKFVPIFSKGGPRLNDSAQGFRLLQIIEDFLQSQGDSSAVVVVWGGGTGGGAAAVCRRGERKGRRGATVGTRACYAWQCAAAHDDASRRCLLARCGCGNE